MTVSAAQESGMRAYLRVLLLSGELPDCAARQVAAFYQVPDGPERDALIDRLSAVTVPNTHDEGSNQ